jgi:hypothetical protein
MTTPIRYHEKVYQPTGIVVLLAAIAIAQATGAAAAFAKGAPIALSIVLGGAALIVVYIAFALRWFEVTIDAAGVRYGWAGFPGGAIPAEEVVSAEAARYPWIYGYGWRVAGRTICYSMPFAREALAIGRSRGVFRRYLFTVSDPRLAADAVRAAVGGRPHR